MSTSLKWFVRAADGETSGGFFETEQAAEDHLVQGLQMFPDVAAEYRVVSGHVTFDDDEKRLAVERP
jgi:hypothetical protein